MPVGRVSELREDGTVWITIDGEDVGRPFSPLGELAVGDRIRYIGPGPGSRAYVSAAVCTCPRDAWRTSERWAPDCVIHGWRVPRLGAV